MQPTVQRIIDKLLSGKFIFTVCCGALLYHGTIMKLFDPVKTLDIIKDVVIFYFVVKNSKQI
jgi:hypothetical protein